MPPVLHEKARRGQPRGYPTRFPVPDDRVPWEVPFPGYTPPYYVAPRVLAKDRTKDPRGWADPEEIEGVTRAFRSFEGTVGFDDRGRPRNPRGRTGVSGRGLLGAWGANFAADPVVTRLAPEGAGLEVLLIARGDSGEWALPGGMADPGEPISGTLARELEEEAGVRLDWSGAQEVCCGYVDDPRNTDHAWMETVVRHLHLAPPLSARLGLRAGDDATAVKWAAIDRPLLAGLWADHGGFLRAALVAALASGAFPELSERRREIESAIG